jgi:hypothetical protein
MTLVGFPHSEISVSKVVCTSTKLIAAYHVLHRLPVPRHPPSALSNLIESLYLLKSILTTTVYTTQPIGRYLYLHFYLRKNYEVVKEPDLLVLFMEMAGIEPTTCGLQSHRSPN